MQELADKVMYHSFLDNIIKGVFLNWYESKLDELKNELFSYTNELISNEAEVVLNDLFFLGFLKTFSFFF